MKLSELKQQGVADRACGWPSAMTLDSNSVPALCAAIRSQKLERGDIVAILQAISSSVVVNWPRTSRGFTTQTAADVLEWLDTASDAVSDGVGLSDWVAK